MSGEIVQSFKVASTLSAYRIVGGYSGSADTVGYPESAQAPVIGVTLNDVKNTTEAIPVAVGGSIAKVYFNDSCTAWGFVASDTSGRGIQLTLAVTSTGATLAKAYVGLLCGPAVQTTGTLADVLVMPGMSR